MLISTLPCGLCIQAAYSRYSYLDNGPSTAANGRATTANEQSYNVNNIIQQSLIVVSDAHKRHGCKKCASVKTSTCVSLQTLEDTTSYHTLGNAVTAYHVCSAHFVFTAGRTIHYTSLQVLDYAGKEDTAMYCVPASEEQRLYSQITSYGVKDVPDTDIT